MSKPDAIDPYTWQDAFTLVLKVSPSWQLDYGIKLALSGKGVRLWTKNAPGIDAFHLSRPFTRGSGSLLPRAETDRILALLSQVRLSASACGDLGCDGTTYHLKVVRGSMSIDLEWWEGTAPKGWEGLEPLIEVLEGYCSKFGQRPDARQDAD